MFCHFQALGMLFWHKHNLEKSLTDLANFTPFPGNQSINQSIYQHLIVTSKYSSTVHKAFIIYNAIGDCLS